MVRNLPRTSAVFRAVHGEEAAEWGLVPHLLAEVVDNTAWLVWSKTKDAARAGARPPKPYPRPGLVDDSVKRIGGSTLPADEMLAWLGGEFVAPSP